MSWELYSGGVRRLEGFPIPQAPSLPHKWHLKSAAPLHRYKDGIRVVSMTKLRSKGMMHRKQRRMCIGETLDCFIGFSRRLKTTRSQAIPS